MAKLPSKAANSIYCKARMKAAQHNHIFASREGAANEIGVSKDSLTDYELGLCKVVPVDKVIIMADVYDSPELLNNYCCNECPIGKKIVQPIDQENIENIYRFAVFVSKDLEESINVQKTLLKIVEDGVIDESEHGDLKYIIDFFTNLEKRSSELRILAEKHSQDNL